MISNKKVYTSIEVRCCICIYKQYKTTFGELNGHQKEAGNVCVNILFIFV